MSLTVRVASLVLVLTAAAVWFASSDVSAADEKPIAVSAEQLAKEYRGDAAAADKKYKGKVLVVEGKVHDLYGKEISGEPAVIVWGYREKELEVPTLLQCFFTKDLQEKAGKLKKEDKVKIQGKCEGSLAKIFVVLKGCEFAK